MCSLLRPQDGLFGGELNEWLPDIKWLRFDLKFLCIYVLYSAVSLTFKFVLKVIYGSLHKSIFENNCAALVKQSADVTSLDLESQILSEQMKMVVPNHHVSIFIAQKTICNLLNRFVYRNNVFLHPVNIKLYKRYTSGVYGDWNYKIGILR